MQIFCDFDGTITIDDATDIILTRLADSEWEIIEEEWKQGKIGSGECMRRQIALIRASQELLDDTLDQIDVDAAFPDFAAFCKTVNVPLTIISDGVDYFIRRILSRFALGDLPVIANHLKILPGAYELSSPYSANDCASAAGVCKCRAVGAHKNYRIYIGDGRSDFCVSNKPEFVFAKGKFAEFCRDNGIAFTPYETFTDIAIVLKAMLADSQNPSIYANA